MRYFALDVMPRREVQADGRIRLWGYVASLDGYLRIV
jgi:hypothetical protein